MKSAAVLFQITSYGKFCRFGLQSSLAASYSLGYDFLNC
jgi:hypothetical protein